MPSLKRNASRARWFAEAAPVNGDRPCSVSGCPHKRLTGTASPYCRKHRQQQRRTGHPLAPTIKAHQYGHHETFIRRLLDVKENASRPVIADAVGQFDQMLRGAASRVAAGSPSRQDVALYQHSVQRKVTGIDLAARALAVWVFLDRHRMRGIPTMVETKVSDVALARAILTTYRHAGIIPGSPGAGRRRLPEGPILRDLGEAVRLAIAPAVGLILLAVEAHEQRRREMAAKAPLKLPRTIPPR